MIPNSSVISAPGQVPDHSSQVQEVLNQLPLKQEPAAFKALWETFWGKHDIPASQLTRSTVDVPIYSPADLDDSLGQSLPSAEDEMELDEVYPTTSPFEATILELGEDLLPTGHTAFMIRQEYINSYELICRIEAEDKRREGIVLLGQPGIGKSYFMWYILVRRMLVGLPTLIHLGPSLVLLSSLGVRELPPIGNSINLLSALRRCPGLWSLTDSDYSSPPSQLQSWLGVFMVQATSPQLVHYKEWKKQKNAFALCMDAWTWKEIYAKHVCLPGVIESPLNARHLHDTYCRFGPTARTCLRLYSGQSEIKAQEQSIATKIEDISNVLELIKMVQDGTAGDNCHQICLVRPRRHLLPGQKSNVDQFGGMSESLQAAKHKRAVVYSFVSGSIGDAVVERATQAEDNMARALFRKICSDDFELFNRHHYLELLAHRFMQRKKILIQRREEVKVNESRTGSGQAMTRMTFERVMEIPRPVREGDGRSRCVIYLDMDHVDQGLEEGVYYEPSGKNNPTFDSMLLYQGTLFLFQIVSAETHALKVKGLNRLRTSLSAKFQPNFTDADGKRTTTGVDYKLVWVLPEKNSRVFRSEPLSGARTGSEADTVKFWINALGQHYYSIINEPLSVPEQGLFSTFDAAQFCS